MSIKARMTVTIDTYLVAELDRVSREQSESRSRLVEDAVRSWHEERLALELREGYEAMNKENRDLAEANLAAGIEAIE